VKNKTETHKLISVLQPLFLLVVFVCHFHWFRVLVIHVGRAKLHCTICLEEAGWDEVAWNSLTERGERALDSLFPKKELLVLQRAVEEMKRVDVTRVFDGMNCDYFPQLRFAPERLSVQTVANVVSIEVDPSLHGKTRRTRKTVGFKW
jgi:hypothetical protein